MKIRIIVAMALAFVLAVPTMAAAQVPAEVPVQGFLTDETGVPVDGSVSVEFKIYDAETGGTELHSQNVSVSADAGAFTAYLTPSLSIFEDNQDLYLGLAVDGEAEMSPRLKMATVPYAAVAGNAATVEGKSAADFAPSDYQPEWTDIQNVPTEVTDSVTYTASGAVEIDSNNDIGLITTCPDGNVLKWNATGSQWACAADEDDDTTYSAGPGVEISANNTIGLNSSCATGQVLRWTGTQWGCGTDEDTTYLAGDGLQLTSNQFAVDYSSVQQRVSDACTSGEFVMGINQDGTVVCGADQDTDTDTTYSAGTGLDLSGTTFSVAPAGITSTEIDNGTISDVDVANNANIAPTKISGTAATLNSSPTFSGTVTASAVKLSTPKTGRFEILPYDFIGSYSSSLDDVYFNSTGYFYIQSSASFPASVLARASVDLPDGATVTELSCTYFDDHDDATNTDDLEFSANLRRFPKSGSPASGAMATASVTNSIDSTSLRQESDTTISNAVVDTANYRYGMWLRFTAQTYSFNLRFYGCTVEYTYDTL